MARSWAFALALMLPLPALALGANALADQLARAAGRSLAAATGRWLAPPVARQQPVFVEAWPAPEATDAALPTGPARRPAPAAKAAPAVPKGIRVRADAVLRLANGGARPGGVPVPARGERPAGLALVGVSALGIGLVDGDVLTHAAGRPALSAGDVIGVVLGSRASHQPEIWGRFWRNGESWNLVVEQPYPRSKKRASSEESGS
ncbi:MAG: hypothetical protein IT375_34300 [Polyangiaceae bacterium]|nr:hypothetical protein [Polyangiaceae bacterium]